MKQLTSRQAGILIFFSVIALKAIILPAIIYLYAGNGGYVTMFFGFAVDFLVLLGYLWIMKKNPDLSFFDIISSVFGKITAYILYFLLFLYYFFKTMLIIKSLYNYFNEVVYSDLNFIYYIIPLSCLLVFAIRKNWRALGRTSEILFIFIFISLNIVLFITSLNMDITNLLPFLPNGIQPVLSSGIRCSYAFGDYTLLLILMGKIKFNNNSNNQIVFFAFTAISTILNFFIIFLCNFGYTVVNQSVAISDLSLYIDLAVTVSRLEWIALFAWTITLLIQVITYCLCCLESLNRLVPNNFSKYTPYALILTLGLTSLIQGLNIQLLIKKFLTIPFGIISISIQVGIPILLFIAGLILQRRRKTKYVQISI